MYSQYPVSTVDTHQSLAKGIKHPINGGKINTISLMLRR